MTPASTATSPAPTSVTTGVAVVFPGQGSQRPQMAAPWRDDPAFDLWARADEQLGRDVTRLGLAAEADELREPANCQVALFVHHAVMFSAWQRSGGRAVAFAGHSLGEYNALTAAGVLSFSDGLRVVDERARATSDAARQNPGGMVACLGGDADVLRGLCAEAGAHVANDNAPGQLVLSGSDAALERFTAAAAASRAKVVRLDVGAAYHSPLMAPALDRLRTALRLSPFRNATAPVVANVDAAPHAAGADWPALLAAQLTSPVRWRETLLTLTGDGVDEILELGAAPVLTGLAKRVTPDVRRRTISTPDDAAGR